METPMTADAKGQKLLPDKTGLLPSLIQPVVYDGLPAIQLWILLHTQPDVNTTSIKNLVEKGVLKMEIKTCDLKQLLPEDCSGSVISVTLELYDLQSESVIQSLIQNRTDASFSFQATLTPTACYEAFKAFTDESSSIHIKGSVVFRDNEKETEVHILTPLRKIIQRIYKKPVKDLVTVKYFDPREINYKDAPVFISNRVVRSRDITMATAKVVKMNNQLVNPVMLTHPGVPKFTPVIHPGAAINAKNKLWYFDNIKINTIPAQKPSLPVINENEEHAWTDSIDGKKLWYLPEYFIVEPGQTNSVSSSPFLLSFEKIGFDNNGRPVLKGEVRITLESRIPAAAQTKASTIAGSQLVPVPIQNQFFQLKIPFVNSDGNPVTTDFSPSGTTSSNNRIELTFQMTNDWIRNCYGVMSIEGFQASKAQVRIYSTFSGLGKVNKKNLQLMAAATFLKLEMVKDNRLIDAPNFNIMKRALNIGDTTFRFTDTSKNRGPNLNPNLIKATMINKGTIGNTIMVKPGHTIPPKVVSGEELAERSFGREQLAPLFFACKDFGQFYVEDSATEGTVAIGCYEPYRIGEIRFRMYELMPALSTSYYKVHRSLQSPDHFLVQPETFRVTRFSPANPEQAYKACVHFYGAIDEEKGFQDSVAILDISLDPDIPAYAFLQLKQALQKQCNKEPVIEFPGEITEDVVFNWSLPEGSKVNTLNLGRTIQLTVSMNIMQVLTLQAMLKDGVLSGKAVYTLADKNEYSCNLSPNTADVTGPWDNGPLEKIKTANSVNFTNRTERNVVLSKVVRADTRYVELERFELNRQLAPGETISITPQSVDGLFVADCTSEIRAAEPDGSWVFIDDLGCQVIFSTDIDFPQRNVTAIDIEASIADGPVKIYSGQLTPALPAFEFESFIALNKISGSRTVSFRTRLVTAAGVGAFSEWKQWSLKDQGNVVNLTSDLLFHI